MLSDKPATCGHGILYLFVFIHIYLSVFLLLFLLLSLKWTIAEYKWSITFDDWLIDWLIDRCLIARQNRTGREIGSNGSRIGERDTIHFINRNVQTEGGPIHSVYDRCVHGLFSIKWKRWTIKCEEHCFSQINYWLFNTRKLSYELFCPSGVLLIESNIDKLSSIQSRSFINIVR